MKYKINCKVCQTIKNNPKLRQQLYYTAYKREEGDITLTQLYSSVLHVYCSYGGLLNHLKKHQPEILGHKETLAKNRDIKAQKERVESLGKQIGLDEEEVAKVGELVAVVPTGDAEEALDAIIDQGVARIKTGEIKVQVSHIISAAKAKLEHKNRKQDQQLELTKMVYRFAAGKETKLIEDKDVTKEPTGSLDRGPEQSGSVHNEVTRDAVTQWATQVPSDYTEPTD